MQKKRRGKEENIAALYLSPTFLLIAIITLYPVIHSFVLSLTRWDAISMPEPVFCGLSNYFNMLGDEMLRWSLIRTAYFLSLNVSLTILGGFFLALLLNRKFMGRRVCRTFLILPWAVTPVVSALQWRWIFHSTYGILNFILHRLGLIKEYLLFFGDANLAMMTVVVAETWRAMPFIALLCLAGLGTIDPILYESAMIDGAGIWKRFRHITLPMMRRILMMALTLQTIWSIQIFDTIFVLTKGGPASTTIVLNYYVWRTAFMGLDFGYGSALAYLVLYLSLIFTLLYIRITRLR